MFFTRTLCLSTSLSLSLSLLSTRATSCLCITGSIIMPQAATDSEALRSACFSFFVTTFCFSHRDLQRIVTWLLVFATIKSEYQSGYLFYLKKVPPQWIATAFMHHGPSWEADRYLDSPVIPPILRNSDVHYRMHNSSPPTLSHIIPIYAPHPTSLRSILITSSHLRLGHSSGLLPSGFPTKTLYAPLLSSIRAIWPANLSLLNFIILIIFGE